MSGAAALGIEGLSAGYGGVPVVHGVNLEVNPGEVVALLGANGAGKTTTLLTISGFLAPIAGSVSVFGEVLPHGRPHRVARRGVIHVPEDRGLFFELSARDNLRIGLGSGRRAREERVARAIEMFPALEPLLDRQVGLLSGGEQQMLAMAGAIADQPKLLLLDEMSHGLAPIIVERLLGIVRETASTVGCGVLLVEQHVELALEVADRAYVMTRGEASDSMPAAELRGKRDTLQAAYLGEASFEAVADDQGR